MAVRLQTAEGEIKEYETTRVETVKYLGEGVSIDKYVAKCGREWKNKPKLQEECNHIYCAIAVAEHLANSSKSASTEMPIFGAIFLFISILAETVFHSRVWCGIGLFMGSILVLFGALAVWSYPRDARRLQELVEFSDHGTIGGIKACVLESTQPQENKII